MEFDYKALGANIRKRRKEKKLRQADLAEMVDVSDTHIGRIENGKGVPSLATLAAIANALDTGIDRLVYGSLSNKTDHFVKSILGQIKDMSHDGKNCAMEMFQVLLNVYLTYHERGEN